MVPNSGKQTNRQICMDVMISFSIDKVSCKSNSKSLGIVISEEKMFRWTQMPQSDAIMSADIKRVQVNAAIQI